MRQPSFHIEKICNTSSSSAHRNMTDLRVRVTKTLAKIHVERGNFSGSDNRMIAECVSVTVGDDMNQFQNITDGEVSWISKTAILLLHLQNCCNGAIYDYDFFMHDAYKLQVDWHRSEHSSVV